MFLLITFASVTFLVDQLSKRFAQLRVERAPVAAHFLRIHAVHHREVVYHRPLFRAALILLWCFAAGAAVRLHEAHTLLNGSVALAAMGCALGGAAGNLTDILRRRRVTNFIDLQWWPVFNLADVAIVGGLLIAFWA